MARIPRLVVPGCPHHVTQRGNRKLKTFFCEEDYLEYLDLVKEARAKAAVEVWAYCVMPNHVHFVVVPADAEGLCKFMQHSHRRYARRVNAREKWQGHLWQERFHSVVMDERHLFAAVRYIELNPRTAGLCRAPEDWIWSSAGAHLSGEDDELVTVRPMLDRAPDWADYLAMPNDVPAILGLHQNAKSGRPVGDDEFIKRLQRLTGRDLRKKRPGPPRRSP